MLNKTNKNRKIEIIICIKTNHYPVLKWPIYKGVKIESYSLAHQNSSPPRFKMDVWIHGDSLSYYSVNAPTSSTN